MKIRRLISTFLAFGCLLVTNVALCKELTASNNSVFGAVTIRDKNGNEIVDRSGVVVFIDGIENRSSIGPATPIPTVSHWGMRFSPRVLAVTAGQKVDFLNDDRIFHNVFSLSRPKTFDLGIYPEGSSKFITFEKAGLVKIYCNMHPNMIGNILVLQNNHFTITDSGGNFEISNLPDGNFMLRMWHEFSAEARFEISFKKSSRVEKNIALVQSKKILPHKNKFGKSYRKKY